MNVEIDSFRSHADHGRHYTLPIIRLQNVSKSFEATRALKQVSLDIHRGTVHCILGENGAGKSTIGKILAGVYEADSGQILLDGKPVEIGNVKDARTNGIATVFQELSLVPDLNVRENIVLGTETNSTLFPRQIRSEKERCRATLAELDLDIDPESKVSTLATAQQQLIELAKALQTKPRILVLDEPTAMLGITERRKLLDIVRRLRETGCTIIFISHHLDEVIEIGDRISIMRDGVLIETFDLDGTIDADQIISKTSGKLAQESPTARPAPAGPPLLSLNGIPHPKKTVRMDLRRGEVVGIYGVVGCGREKIAETVVGLRQPPGDMAMTFKGETYRPRSPAAAAKLGIGYLPTGRAGNGILPSLTIRENLTITQLAGFRTGLFIKKRKEKAATESQLARLRTRMQSPEHRITSLSGGNQQKVLLGRWLTERTELVVMEDPTAGIDIGAKLEIHELIRKRVAEGLSVLLISSDLRETIDLCSTVYTMFQGSLVNRYDLPSNEQESQILTDVLGTSSPALRQQ